MSKIDDDIKKHFCDIIDEAILEGQKDPLIKDGFDTLDEWDRGLKMSFYDLMMSFYEEWEIIEHVKQWKKKKDIRDGRPK